MKTARDLWRVRRGPALLLAVVAAAVAGRGLLSAAAQVIEDPAGLVAVGTSGEQVSGSAVAASNGGNATVTGVAVPQVCPTIEDTWPLSMFRFACGLPTSVSGAAVSTTGSASGGPGFWNGGAASLSGCADSSSVAISALGCAGDGWGVAAVSGTGAADGSVAVSGTGSAQSCTLAVSANEATPTCTAGSTVGANGITVLGQPLQPSAALGAGAVAGSLTVTSGAIPVTQSGPITMGSIGIPTLPCTPNVSWTFSSTVAGAVAVDLRDSSAAVLTSVAVDGTGCEGTATGSGLASGSIGVVFGAGSSYTCALPVGTYGRQGTALTMTISGTCTIGTTSDAVVVHLVTAFVPSPPDSTGIHGGTVSGTLSALPV